MSCALFDCTRTPCHFGLKILDLARQSLFRCAIMSDPHPIFVDRTPCARAQSRDRCCVCFRADVSPHLLRLHSVHHEGHVYEVCQICDLSAQVQELATCGAGSAEALFLVEHRLRELRRFLENDFCIYKQRQLEVGQSRTSAAERGPGETTGLPAVCICGSELPMGPVPPAPPGPPPVEATVSPASSSGGSGPPRRWWLWASEQQRWLCGPDPNPPIWL